jgi:hypothetical protein
MGMTRARRHHYIAQFYLRNFAAPLFSENIHVYEYSKGCWDKRTPKGVGWFPHLYSMFTENGERTDGFETFLSKFVEGPTSTALKHAAELPASITAEDKQAIAWFIGITAARLPSMIGTVEKALPHSLPVEDLRDLNLLVNLWCAAIGHRTSDMDEARRDFLKPSVFGAILVWATSIRDRLMQWTWTLVRTTPGDPFITSDWPVFAQRDDLTGIHLVSFPISSEVAFIISNSNAVRQDKASLDHVRAINRQTLHKSSEFVVCLKQGFPGDEYLRCQ